MFEVWITSENLNKWIFMGSFDTSEEADADAEILEGYDEDDVYWEADVRQAPSSN